MEVCVLPNPALSTYGLLNLSILLSNHFIVTASQFVQFSILISKTVWHVVQLKKNKKQNKTKQKNSDHHSSAQPKD